MLSRLNSVAAAAAALSLCVSPTVAGAASTLAAASSTTAAMAPGAKPAPIRGVSAGLAQGCAATIGIAGAAAAQAVRPGCVLPAVGNPPIVAQTMAPAIVSGGFGIGAFPILAGVAAALLGAYLLFKGGDDDDVGDLSPG